MAYLKRLSFNRNARALALAFDLEKQKRTLLSQEERELLQHYSGFGGLKFILNPHQSEADLKYWAKADQVFWQDVGVCMPLLENIPLMKGNSKTMYKVLEILY